MAGLHHRVAAARSKAFAAESVQFVAGLVGFPFDFTEKKLEGGGAGVYSCWVFFDVLGVKRGI